jgi:quercetin dioxygenase-like cupin family protein
MPHYSPNEPEYWAVPPKYEPMVDLSPTMRMTWFILGDDDDEDAPAAMVLDMQPGHVIARHAHECERIEIVVSGTLDVGDRTLRAGDIMVAHPGEFYGPHIAGPEGCVTLEVFSAARETHQIVYQAEDGTIVKPDTLVGEFRPRRLAGMEGVRDKVAAVLAAVAERSGADAAGAGTPG